MSNQKRRSSASGLTLKEAAHRAGVSLHTAQRYKRLHARRIPSTGRGRTQRYPEAAIAVFRELKREGLAKRGRPPVAKRTAANRAGEPKSRGRLLSLRQIGGLTKISYPTLQRYVTRYLDRLPHEGRGRRKRFLPEAVDVFRSLFAASRPGRPRREPEAASAPVTGGWEQRLRALEKSHRALAIEVTKLLGRLQKPVRLGFSR